MVGTKPLVSEEAGRLGSQEEKGPFGSPEYFTCERFKCFMRKAVCLNRQCSQIPAAGGWAYKHLECVNCPQGKEIIRQNTEGRIQNTEDNAKTNHENTKEGKHEKEVEKMEEMKRCSKCLVEKPLAEFNKHKQCKDGHEGQCKSCKHEYTKKAWKKKQEARRLGSQEARLKAESSKPEGKTNEKKQGTRREPVIEITAAGEEMYLLSRTIDILVAAGLVSREKVEKAMEIAGWK